MNTDTSAMETSFLKLEKGSAIALVYRLQTAAAVSVAQKVATYLQKKGFEVYTAPGQKLIPGTKAARSKKQLDEIKLAIVLGGDGTYLRGVRVLEGRNIPLLGFNMGSLGFLTVHPEESAFKIIDKTIKGEMALLPTSMLYAKVMRKGKKRVDFHALNDLVLERGSFSQLINTAIYSEKFLVSQIKADGIIVSTPSGSTAYNLAAGGPIVHPEAPVLVVAPVAPHSLTSRPLIFPDQRAISFKLEGKTQKAHLIVDGQKMTEVTAADEVIVMRSCYDHWMVREPNHNFYHLLREKLKFGDRN
ncbi:inorganic polyphosphate/ATP-NAD kinase [Bdellovibrio bacteriovorus W]|nr:inorganic polyphosphate/ATP-NAD kinase [Bdellovibrio bacteriovorus W]